MGRLVEDMALRDKVHVFRDRQEAGRLLSEKLMDYKGSDGIILAIPSGGIPVAVEAASVLELPLDLLIVRKIQIPYNPEAGFGAVGPDQQVVLNEQLLARLALTDTEVKAQTEEAAKVIRKRNKLFRDEKPFPTVRGHNVIVIDDGLASGYTMTAAVRFVRTMSPSGIIIAVPTGSRSTVDSVLPEADELVCLNIRRGPYFAVADAYENWYDLTDDEVLALLRKLSKDRLPS